MKIEELIIDQTLINEDFNKIGRAHDWRNYVPSEIIDIWNDLTHRERTIIYILCENQASNEKWD